MADATLKMTIDAGPAIKSIAEVQELIRSHAALRAEVEALRADANALFGALAMWQARREWRSMLVVALGATAVVGGKSVWRHH